MPGPELYGRFCGQWLEHILQEISDETVCEELLQLKKRRRSAE